MKRVTPHCASVTRDSPVLYRANRIIHPLPICPCGRGGGVSQELCDAQAFHGELHVIADFAAPEHLERAVTIDRCATRHIVQVSRLKWQVTRRSQHTCPIKPSCLNLFKWQIKISGAHSKRVIRLADVCALHVSHMYLHQPQLIRKNSFDVRGGTTHASASASCSTLANVVRRGRENHEQ